jgi:hypothetical protein
VLAYFASIGSLKSIVKLPPPTTIVITRETNVSSPALP